MDRRRAFAALSLGLAAAPAVARAAPPASQLFVFLYRPGPAWKAGQPMEKQALGGHVRYMQSLLDAGKLFAGGRFLPADQGMALVIAADIDEARAILAADPSLTGGVFVAEVQQWRLSFQTANPLPTGT